MESFVVFYHRNLHRLHLFESSNISIEPFASTEFQRSHGPTKSQEKKRKDVVPKKMPKKGLCRSHESKYVRTRVFITDF